MIRFRVFSFREMITVEREVVTFFGGVHRETFLERAYLSTTALYNAVAVFASGVNVVSISGTPWGAEDSINYLSGEVVVWYKETS